MEMWRGSELCVTSFVQLLSTRRYTKIHKGYEKEDYHETLLYSANSKIYQYVILV